MSDTPENVISSIPPLDPGGGPPSDDNLPGMQLGDYVIEKAVAWGGMGIVYRAVHPLIGRKVAVKVLRPNFASDPEQMSRFLKEAQAISSIKHRGIIDIIGFGKIPMPDGRQYMVMEFLDGESLEAVMQREGAMSPHRALTIIEEVLDALSAAHKVGVVHRDLKPSNVYITLQSNGSRYVKLVDFGLARRASIADLNRHSGKASLMAGTPEYLSPEQAKGMAATPRTDLYCLGVMLFEMITGRLPFIEDSMIELLNAHITKPAPRASTFIGGVPAPIDELIAHLLLKQPEQRPNTADSVRLQVQRMLRQLQEDETRIGAPPPAPAPLAEETKFAVRRPPAAVRGASGPPSEGESTMRVSHEEFQRFATDQQRAPPPAQTLEVAQVQEWGGAPPRTQPDLAPKLTRWVFVAIAAGVLAIGGSILLFHAPPEPDAPLVVGPPPPLPIVAPPPVEPERVESERPAPKPAVQPVVVAVDKVAQPPRPKPVVKPPRPAVKAEIPWLCEETDRKAMGISFAEKAGHDYLQHNPPPRTDPARKQQAEAFVARARTAKTREECGDLINEVVAWRKTTGLTDK